MENNIDWIVNESNDMMKNVVARQCQGVNWIRREEKKNLGEQPRLVKKSLLKIDR